MVHPHTELRFVNPTIGFGVFATQRIPQGTIVWVRDDFDQTFTQEQVDRMEPLYRAVIDKYAYVDYNGCHVLCWDHSRFFNHSCEATCMCCGFDFEIAVRDIEVGEQLTDDYGTLNLREHFPCACGEPGCRAYVMPNDMEHLHPVWDEKVKNVFPLIPQVDQPLWALVKDKKDVAMVLQRPELLRSSLIHYAPLPGRAPKRASEVNGNGHHLSGLAPAESTQNGSLQ